MQTLKTAAIVALLMTVMYGGYVSLTTPPDEIPPEVADLLVVDELGGEGTLAGISDGVSSENPPLVAMGEVEAIASSETFAGPSKNPPAVSMDLPPALNSPRSTSETPETFAAIPKASTPAKGVSFEPKPTLPSDPGNLADDGKFALPNPNPAAANLDSPNPAVSPSMDVPTTSVSEIELPSMEQLGEGPGDLNQLPNTEQAVSATPPPPTVMKMSDNPPANQGLINAFKTADRQYANGQLSEALATLSVFYDMPDLPAKQRGELLARLDPLARIVIYSRRHLLEQPHRIGANETLMEVAQRYNVPWQLLANINGIQDPLVTVPGTELKVIKGPFSANVDLNSNELTVFLGDLYAGRFPIATGQSPAPSEGTFTVQDKQSQRTFNGPNGLRVAAGAPGNPYGNMWIDLGGQLSIHGSPNPSQPTDQGCISLAAGHADDLFGILSQGSSVTIRR